MRLVPPGGRAHGFFGEKAEGLPKAGRLMDVSESGARLALGWPASKPFPIAEGESLGFHLAIEGVPGEFNVITKIRRVSRSGAGTVELGVEFVGLGPSEAAAIKQGVEALAVRKLKSLKAPGPESPAKARPSAPPVQPAARAQAARPGRASRTAGFEFKAPAAAPPPAAGGETEALQEPEESLEPEPAGAAASAAPAAPKKRRRKPYLGEVLVRMGAIDTERLDQFLATEFTGSQKLGDELRRKGLVTDEQVARALAEQARLPFVEFALDFDLSRVAGKLSRLIFVEHRCVPVREEDGGAVVVVAMSSPPALEEMEKLSSAIGKRIKPAIAREGLIEDALAKLYNVRGKRREGDLRHETRMECSYRFCDSAWTAYVGGPARKGLTLDVSHGGLKVVGPLPDGITPVKIAREGLMVEVTMKSPFTEKPLQLSCRPVRVELEEGDLYALGCAITGFPSGSEDEWSRLCTQLSIQGLRPRKERF